MNIQLNNVVTTYTESNKILQYNQTIPLSPQGFSVLQGDSGSGKSTLLHLLANILPPTSGEITGTPQDKTVLMFQEPRLFPWRTVLQHITDVLPKNNKKQALFHLEQVGLQEEAKQKPTSLSGGMQRRLSLARTLAYGNHIGAELYLLDEPFTGIDQGKIDHYLNILSTLQGNVLIASHLPSVAKVASQIITASPTVRINSTQYNKE